MSARRDYLAVGVVGGKLYAIGGRDENGSFKATNEEYDPSTDTWTTRSPMPTPRSRLAVVEVGGRLLAIGGTNGTPRLGTTEEYDPVNDTWTSRADLLLPRSALGAAVIHGKVYAIGGFTGSVRVGTNEEYDPSNDTWTTKTPMPSPRAGLAAGVLNGRIYTIGGFGSGSERENEEYDPISDSWVGRPMMPTPRSGLAVGVWNASLHAIGGEDPRTGISSVNEVYDPLIPDLALTSDPEVKVYANTSGTIEATIENVGYDVAPIALLNVSFSLSGNGVSFVIIQDITLGVGDAITLSADVEVPRVVGNLPLTIQAVAEAMPGRPLVEENQANNEATVQITTFVTDQFDQDGDGIPDGWEHNNSLDPWNASDASDDPDIDGLTNLQEFLNRTNPHSGDTDDDGMPDRWEILNGLEPSIRDADSDADLDELTNIQEFLNGTDPQNPDSDHDGMPDGWEVSHGFNPLRYDADFDADSDDLTNLQEYLNTTDPRNPDTDGDGIPDGWEVSNQTHPLFDDAARDPDRDDLTNSEEYARMTDPLDPDSDQDGMPDGWETQNLLDPLDLSDSNLDSETPFNDGLTNLGEYLNGTDPQEWDTDSDGIGDGFEVFFSQTNPTRRDSNLNGIADGPEFLQTHGYLGTIITLDTGWVEASISFDTNTFDVRTNSTVFHGEFVVEDRRLVMTVKGPAGTRGGIEITAPRSLVDSTGIRISLDGNSLTISVTQNQTHIIASAEYIHSTRELTVAFDVIQSDPGGTEPDTGGTEPETGGTLPFGLSAGTLMALLVIAVTIAAIGVAVISIARRVGR